MVTARTFRTFSSLFRSRDTHACSACIPRLATGQRWRCGRVCRRTAERLNASLRAARDSEQQKASDTDLAVETVLVRNIHLRNHPYLCLHLSSVFRARNFQASEVITSVLSHRHAGRRRRSGLRSQPAEYRKMGLLHGRTGSSLGHPLCSKCCCPLRITIGLRCQLLSHLQLVVSLVTIIRFEPQSSDFCWLAGLDCAWTGSGR